MSSLFGKGKGSILRLFCSNNEISDMIAHAFLDPNASIDCIDEWECVYAHCVSHDAYNKQCMSANIKPECLPTAENTAFQHGRRVFRQCCEWTLLDHYLTDALFCWQWVRDRRMFLLVYTSKPVATKELETFISCHCQGSCSKNIYYYSLNSVNSIPSVCGHWALLG